MLAPVGRGASDGNVSTRAVATSIVTFGMLMTYVPEISSDTDFSRGAADPARLTSVRGCLPRLRVRRRRRTPCRFARMPPMPVFLLVLVAPRTPRVSRVPGGVFPRLRVRRRRRTRRRRRRLLVYLALLSTINVKTDVLNNYEDEWLCHVLVLFSDDVRLLVNRHYSCVR